MTDQAADEKMLLAEAKAPRVTLAEYEANVKGTSIVKEVTPSGQILRWGIVTAQNGFAVTGRPSAAVSAENDNPELGERYAIDNAKMELWPLMAYELKSKLHQIKLAGDPTGAILKFSGLATYIGTKVVHAVPMNRSTYNVLRGWELPANEDGADEGYLVQYTDGGQQNLEGFTGYISWSLKGVFEGSYTNGTPPKKTTHVERMRAEETELSSKIKALAVFIRNNPIFATLPVAEQEDMRQQLAGMDTYHWHLSRRLARVQAATM